MFLLETSKANLKKTDYDILEFIEYPKTVEEVKSLFPEENVTVKILEFLDKGLVEERKDKYVSKFHTFEVKRIIDGAKVPEIVKKNFHFFLSQVDNPFVRQNMFDSDARQKSELVFSTMAKSLNAEITPREMTMLNLAMEDLMGKLT